MTDQPIARIDTDSVLTKEMHDLMLAVPVRDGFCRFYGGYVAVGSKACFADGHVHECVATETFVATDETC